MVDKLLKVLMFAVFVLVVWLIANWTLGDKEQRICQQAVNKQVFNCEGINAR